MTPRLFLILSIVEAALIGGVFLLYPRITRHGLLFGVYVGEEAASGAEARRITRSWYRGMIAWIAASVIVGAVLGAAIPYPAVAVAPALFLVPGFFILYLRAYGQARRIAHPGAPPGVAVVTETSAPSSVFPPIALAVALACGLFAIAYSWSAYDLLPERVPTHFGISGAPDAFRPKSFFTVMLSPLLALIAGVGVGGVAWLTAHAKRSFRYPASLTSVTAQIRFRLAVTRLLCWVSLIVSLLLTVMSVSMIRVGLGREQTLSPAVWVLAPVLLLGTLGGVVYVAVRYGQGGARLEDAASGGRLTDGLADNRHWVLGMFYVNREDPSILVEHRFGLGYTLNLGNWKAVALVGGFVLALLILALAALVTM